MNECLLPGPVLGPSLMGVLLRFRQHSVAISGDRLLAEDRSYLRFICRDMRREEPAEVYEWQVLPFGTTCSSDRPIYQPADFIARYSRFLRVSVSTDTRPIFADF